MPPKSHSDYILNSFCRGGTTWYCASLEPEKNRELVPARVSQFKSGPRRIILFFKFFLFLFPFNRSRRLVGHIKKYSIYALNLHQFFCNRINKFRRKPCPVCSHRLL